VRSLVFLLTLAACAEPSWERCADLDCRKALVASAIDADPAAAARDIGALEPVAQLALVRHLADASPTRLSALCAALDADTPAAERCARMAMRPHLKTPAAIRKVFGGARAAPGPSSGHLPPPKVSPLQWTEPDAQQIAHVLGDCVAGTTCVEERAFVYARERNLQQVAVACTAGFPDLPVASAECWFGSAEALARRERWRAFADVMRLCAQTGPFVPACMDHTLALSLPAVSPADRPTAETTERVARGIDGIAEVVGQELAGLYADRLWAQWVNNAFFRAERVTGHLLAALPPQATPHVRAAAAAALITEVGEAPSLDGWTAQLAAALEQTGPVVPSGGRIFDMTLRKARDMWGSDRPDGEGEIPAVFYLGPDRRALGATPQDDLQIAALEAAARLSPPPPASFFIDIARSDRALEVRWTAARHASVLFPRESAAAMESVTDARIQARLRP